MLYLRMEAGQHIQAAGEVRLFSVCNSRPEAKLHIRSAQSSPPNENPLDILTISYNVTCLKKMSWKTECVINSWI